MRLSKYQLQNQSSCKGWGPGHSDHPDSLHLLGHSFFKVYKFCRFQNLFNWKLMVYISIKSLFKIDGIMTYPHAPFSAMFCHTYYNICIQLRPEEAIQKPYTIKSLLLGEDHFIKMCSQLVFIIHHQPFSLLLHVTLFMCYCSCLYSWWWSVQSRWFSKHVKDLYLNGFFIGNVLQT